MYGGESRISLKDVNACRSESIPHNLAESRILMSDGKAGNTNLDLGRDDKIAQKTNDIFSPTTSQYMQVEERIEQPYLEVLGRSTTFGDVSVMEWSAICESHNQEGERFHISGDILDCEMKSPEITEPGLVDVPEIL